MCLQNFIFLDIFFLIIALIAATTWVVVQIVKINKSTIDEHQDQDNWGV